MKLGIGVAALLLVACRKAVEPGSDASSDAGAAKDASPADVEARPDAAEVDAGIEVRDAGQDAGSSSEDAGVDAGPSLEPGTLEVEWIHGAADCDQSSDPPFQVHAYNASTFILRQNKCADYEGPFIYVLFGDDRVLVEDTGAVESEVDAPIRSTIEDLIATWLAGRSRDSIELVVAHSHAHGDHTAGDAQFAGQPNTRVVGTTVSVVSAFFGIASWPDSIAAYDLGGRVLDIVPIPGHQTSHIAIYDRDTGLLLTGDTLYPGRLYVNQWDTYRDSIERLSAFALEDEHPIAHVLGTHVEMSVIPGVDYPIGSTHQPDEHPLQLTLTDLLELRDALRNLGSTPQREVHDSFIITPI